MSRYKNIITRKEDQKINMPDEMIKKIKNAMKRSMVLASVPLVFFTSCSGEREYKENLNIITSQGYTDNNTRTSENTVDNKTYNELMEQLDRKLANKNFSNEANEYFRNILNELCKNYPQWQSGYNDLPTVENYINNNLIQCIDNINSVEIYSFSSQKGQDLMNLGYGYGQTDDEGNIIMIFDEEEDFNSKLEKLFHEIAHIKQTRKSDSDFFKGNEKLIDAFIEGGATYHQKLVSERSSEQRGAWSIANDEGTYTLDYGKNNAIGYLLYLNIYENLEYLAGYKMMNRMEKGEISPLEIKEVIAEKYGKNMANSIFDEMGNLCESYDENWQSDETYNSAIKLQNLELKCIEQDIERLDTDNPEEIKKYIDVYRNYKLSGIPTVKDSNEKDCTYDEFKLHTLDDLLAEKIAKSKAIKFSSNKKLNKMAIKVLLYTSHDDYYDNTGIYENSYLPSKISKYKYVEQGENSAYMMFENNDESIVVYFNEDNINFDKIIGISNDGLEK